jgi:hypothetical protein
MLLPCHVPEILSIEQDEVSALNLSHHLVQFRFVFRSWICYDSFQAYAFQLSVRPGILFDWYDTLPIPIDCLRERAELSSAIFMAREENYLLASKPSTHEPLTVTLDTRPPK